MKTALIEKMESGDILTAANEDLVAVCQGYHHHHEPESDCYKSKVSPKHSILTSSQERRKSAIAEHRRGKPAQDQAEKQYQKRLRARYASDDDESDSSSSGDDFESSKESGSYSDPDDDKDRPVVTIRLPPSYYEDHVRYIITEPVSDKEEPEVPDTCTGPHTGPERIQYNGVCMNQKNNSAEMS